MVCKVPAPVSEKRVRRMGLEMRNNLNNWCRQQADKLALLSAPGVVPELYYCINAHGMDVCIVRF